MSELNEFLKTILPKIGEDSCSKIKEILLANNFTSRLSLKLLTPANLDALFTDVNLPLGSRKVLEYQLNLLNDESPLNTKVRHKRSSYSEQEEPKTLVENTEKVSDNESAKRALEKRRVNIETQIEQDELSLSELQVNLDSMNINVPALPAIGNGKVTCGNCHHRGHRTQTNQPCNLQKCISFTYCGIRDKHPEYFAEMNKLKASIKKKRDDIKALQEQLTGIKNFVSQSEHQFLKALTPRMMKVDPSYKLNKQKLLRDIRILRTFYNGKIPVETTNDAEQLRISLSKCKQTLEHEVGVVGVQGIRQYEESHGTKDGKNAINLNVTCMSVSPESTSSVSNSGVMNSMSVTNSVVDTVQDTAMQGSKTKSKARKLVFKHKRKTKSKKGNIKNYSSSSSESESQSESSSSSSTSDDNRRYISKKKRKRKSKHNRASRNTQQAEVYADNAGLFGERNLHSRSNQNFLATQNYHQNFTPQAQMIYPETSYYPFRSYNGQMLPLHPYNFARSDNSAFSPNLGQWSSTQTSFTNQNARLLASLSDLPAAAASDLTENNVATNLPNNTEINGLSLLSSAVIELDDKSDKQT